MRSLPLLLVVPLFGCDDPTSTTAFISPFDGQTDWPATAPLQVHPPDPIGPEGQEVPSDLLRVVDLDMGGAVSGQVAFDGIDLWFYPDEPFASGHRFAWSISAPFDQAREAHITLPRGLQGVSTFHTGARTEPLAVVYEQDEVCVLLSRDTNDGGVRVWTNGAPIVMNAPVPLTADGFIPATPTSAAVQCGPSPRPLDGLRIERGSDVWQVDIQNGTAESALRLLHRTMAAK